MLVQSVVSLWTQSGVAGLFNQRFEAPTLSPPANHSNTKAGIRKSFWLIRNGTMYQISCFRLFLSNFPLAVIRLLFVTSLYRIFFSFSSSLEVFGLFHHLISILFFLFLPLFYTPRFWRPTTNVSSYDTRHLSTSSVPFSSFSLASRFLTKTDRCLLQSPDSRKERKKKTYTNKIKSSLFCIASQKLVQLT